jgi:DnaK suppressor protein
MVNKWLTTPAIFRPLLRQAALKLGLRKFRAGETPLPLVRIPGRNYRRGNRGSHVGYREKPGQQDAGGPGRSGAETLMATGLADEIDVLAKAKRAIGGDYLPSEDEPYMADVQQDYFRRLLLEWKKSILNSAADTLQQLQEGPIREPDLNDRASSETDWGIELRTRDRQRKLIAKIDSALRRIEEGDYGYCEVTGEPIGLGRLIARPVATMTVEAQQAHERREKVSRDD